MAIWTPEMFPVFLLFFVPGFISLKVYDLLVPGGPRDFSKAVWEVVGYSSITLAVGLPFFLTEILSFPPAPSLNLGGKLFISLFIVPVLLPITAIVVLRSDTLGRYVVNPTPSPWDHVFQMRDPHFVIIHTKDGRRIGGWYGEGSFASSYPQEEEIYLEEVWELDESGTFQQRVEDSEGVIVFREEVAMVELYHPGDQDGS